jgi:hypothetical protein
MRLNSRKHDRLNVAMVWAIDTRQEGFAHARIPKVFEVFGNACQRFTTVWHAFKKSSDLVRHANQGVIVCHLLFQ